MTLYICFWPDVNFFVFLSGTCVLHLIYIKSIPSLTWLISLEGGGRGTVRFIVFLMGFFFKVGVLVKVFLIFYVWSRNCITCKEQNFLTDHGSVDSPYLLFKILYTIYINTCSFTKSLRWLWLLIWVPFTIKINRKKCLKVLN